MTYNDIVRVNKELKLTPIKGKDYAEVNQRVKAFRMLYPEGSITTELLSVENGVVIVKATASDDNGKVLATGISYERENSSMINKTSYIENCETSAVGRALGFLGIGIDTSICSADELAHALEKQDKPIRYADANEIKQKIDEYNKYPEGFQTPKYQKRSKEKTIVMICENCNGAITETVRKDGTTMTAHDVAQLSNDRCGKTLCPECLKKELAK